ncbi:hypothetical protein H6G33_19250 [Calothrix sp. FACHB-1219]|uniref:DUF4878 domain-containing protein n=1 Tax=unclassified Calothrix TaxID=2619626 RepID=UPI00168338E4|nr:MULTISPECIES: DUF4878 domain-containing protein [unclassified Calothrix]MBD2206265.1 hypothetical protein [Calothrix sp. FACHB-168]MBD2219161.1 hypothetical protein [Calothrix sp. FACHB-1219]
MKRTLIVTALALAVILFNPIAAAYTKTPANRNLDSIISQVQETATLPEIVTEGLELYKQGNVEAAVNKWTNSMISLFNEVSMDSDQKQEQVRLLKESMPMITMMLSTVREKYGNCQEYSVIKSIQRNPYVRSIYLEMKQEKGSFYMEFITVKTDKDWRISHYHFSPDIEDIFR